MGKYTQAEILEHIHRLSDGGEPPTQIKFELDDDAPSISPVETHFDSWSNAIEAAGYHNKGNRTYSNQDLIDMIQEFGGNEYAPIYSDFTLTDDFPNASTVTNRFGTWNRALRKAGYEPNETSSDTKERILTTIKQLDARIDEELCVSHIKDSDNAPSPELIANTFTTLDRAKKEAGI